MATSRRAVLLAPLLAAACGGGDAPEAPLAPISYSYLTALPLKVGRLEIAETNPPAGPGDVGASLVPRPADAVRTMARDRLSAVGGNGTATFSVTRAAMSRSSGGLSCVLACRLQVTGAEGESGFVQAEARAAVSGSDASRPQAAERLLRRTMDGLNVEFEYQLRRNLRDLLVTVAPGSRGALPAPPAGEVAREDLPRS